MLAGCAASAVMENANDKTGAKGKSSRMFNKAPSDKELFEEALFCLSNDKKEPDYQEAQSKLQNLVSQFPNSHLTTGAEALLLTLDRISALQTALKKEKLKTQGEQVKLTKEISRLKENAEQIEGKYSVEIVKLQQENEQLKKDIQQLKNLEIQLEKREKMIR
ncbi:MAG: hypothetical protein CVU71_12060 [Deltaproteobacteria bacterium HGW-Deltaproteobacteria-6]|jgi:DNA repair ATPase RecN|nr:MAG: hypothetical protein CVU71_12060 [Deltaproteobacteria bacterium HGW-Deltaproteobacteria-6]